MFLEIVYDVEVYPNLFFLCTQEYIDDKPQEVRVWFVNDQVKYLGYMSSHKDSKFIGWNSSQYDNAIIAYWLSNKSCTDQNIKALSDAIVTRGVRPQALIPRYNIFRAPKSNMTATTTQKVLDKYFPTKTIDLMKIVSNVNLSLKQTAITLHSESIMESPVHFNDPVGDDKKEAVINYCKSDLGQTWLVYEKIKGLVEVRDSFFATRSSRNQMMDAYSVGAPKLAETYFIGELSKGRYSVKSEVNPLSTNRKSNTKLTNLLPCLNKELNKLIRLNKEAITLDIKDSNLKQFFNDVIFNGSLHREWRVDIKKPKIISYFVNTETGERLSNEARGEVDEVKIEIKMDDGFGLNFGLGGLHSSGSSKVVRCNDDEIIMNVDVKSYYPSMIIQYGIHPGRLKRLPIEMKKVYDRRMIEKAKGNKVLEQAQKLLMNSTFGKFNDKYSKVYDPSAVYQTTLTGQVLLLVLLDKIKYHLESKGKLYDPINVNTDGLFIRIKKEDIDGIKEVWGEWEAQTGVELDAEYFTQWFQLNVNAYFAVQDNGYIKGKGDIGNVETSIDKAITYSRAVKESVQEFLIHNIPIEETISKLSGDVKNFIVMERNNFGGFYFGEHYLDYKLIRVIFSKQGLAASKRGAHNTTSKLFAGKLAVPVLTLKGVKVSVDVETYENQAYGLLYQFLSHEYSTLGSEKVKLIEKKHFKGWFEDVKPKMKDSLNRLKGLPLEIVPKNLMKDNYQKRFEKLIPLEEASGLGVRCSNTLSIDIDDPSNLDPKLKELLLKYKTLKSWHGVDKVLNGGKGSFIFTKNINQKELGSNNKMVHTHGFEILSGDGKIQMIFGVHPNGDSYNFEGSPIDLPDEIYEYLLTIKPVKWYKKQDKFSVDTVMVENKSDIVDAVKGILISNKFNVNDGVVVNVPGSKDLSISFSDWEHKFTIFVSDTGRVGVNSFHSEWLNYSGIRSLDWTSLPKLITVSDDDLESQYETTRKFLGI